MRTDNNLLLGNLVRGLIVLLLFGIIGCASLVPSSLHVAVFNNDAAAINNMLADGSDVDATGIYSFVGPDFRTTPLCRAAGLGHIEASQALITHGADVNAECLIFDSTMSLESRAEGNALMMAAFNGHVKIVELLLKSGADANMLTTSNVNDTGKWDALFFAAKNGNPDMAQLLLQYGANANAKSENDNKAAYLAIGTGSVEFVKVLVEHGLQLESNLEWVHYNAELAHIAADAYAASDEKQALYFYNKAIELYPQGIKNYEELTASSGRKESAKAIFVATSWLFNPYYYGPLYKANMSAQDFYRMKATNSRKNFDRCEEILKCYESNKADMGLSDCVNTTGSYSL